MYSIINNIFRKSNDRKKTLEELFESGQHELDEEQNKENVLTQTMSGMKNVIRSKINPYETEREELEAAQHLICSKRKGKLLNLNIYN